MLVEGSFSRDMEVLLRRDKPAKNNNYAENHSKYKQQRANDKELENLRKNWSVYAIYACSYIFKYTKLFPWTWNDA